MQSVYNHVYELIVGLMEMHFKETIEIQLNFRTNAIDIWYVSSYIYEFKWFEMPRYNVYFLSRNIIS